jgi:hypothetical protein
MTANYDTQGVAGGPVPPAPPAPPVPPAPPSPGRGGGIGFGIVLIVIGLIFLASQFMPGLAWWSLWPLIIVIAGIVQMVTPGHHEGWTVNRLADGIGTVLIGCVLLGNTTGYIAWDVWWTILSLWPVLIIALGLGILGKALEQNWIRLLGPVLIWLAILYAVSLSVTGMSSIVPVPSWAQPSGAPFSMSEPLGGVEAGAITIKGGAGDISVRGSSRDLVSATGTSPFGSPTLTVARRATLATVSFTLGEPGHVTMWPGVGGAHADITLADSTLWKTTIETGASNLNADMSRVRLKGLTLETGVSDATIKLGEVPSVVHRAPIVVKAGVSSITILLPANAEAHINTHNGLTGTTVASRFVRQDNGEWQTPGYSSAGSAYDINVESGVSSVTVRTY